MIFCKCGCGGELEEFDSKGRKREYINGHNARGRKVLDETRKKLSITHKGKNTWSKGRHHSEETKKKISESGKGVHRSEGFCKRLSEDRKGKTLGKENPNYIDGRTPLVHRIRNCSKYFEWRLNIFERDSFICKNCGASGVFLNAHHIKTLSDIITEYNIKTFGEAMKCSEIWKLDNGITYCAKCHDSLKKCGGKL